MLRNIPSLCYTKVAKIIMVAVVWSASGVVLGQESRFSMGIWHHQSLSLKLAVEALQRNQNVVLQNGATESPFLRDFSGNINFSSRGFLWHPNFFSLNLDAQYRPARKEEKFLVIPDRSEVRTAESYRLQGSFFKRRPLTLGVFNSYAHSFVNRELVSNIETFSYARGGHISLKWPVLPAKLSYRNSDWRQEELATQRTFRNRNEVWEVELSKSFSDKGDDHQLRLSSEDFRREYTQVDEVRNKSKIASFRSNIPFGGKQQSHLMTTANYYKQTGSNSFERISVTENLGVDLPHNFDVNGSFQVLRFRQNGFKNDKTNASSQVRHKLFLSLETLLFHEWSKTSQREFSELYNTAGIKLKYSKKIPTGRLQLNYGYEFRQQDRDAQPTQVTIVDEEHRLDDTKTVLLDYPFVDINSIVVTDQTGTIIYQENFDYILIQRGSFVEIQRLPGGQIENNQNVFIDYIVLEQGAYRFDQISKTRGGNLFLLGRFIEGYYREFEQEYQNIQAFRTDFLKFITQKVYGVKVDLGVLSGGYERDEFQSNIVPYESDRYYATLNHTFGNKLNFLVTGSKRDFFLIDDNEEQKFWDASGRLAWYLKREMRITLESGYRVQEGRGLDLDLFNFKGEFRASYRQLEFIAGVQLYRRTFINEQNDFDGIYFRLERMFR